MVVRKLAPQSALNARRWTKNRRRCSQGGGCCGSRAQSVAPTFAQSNGPITQSVDEGVLVLPALGQRRRFIGVHRRRKPVEVVLRTPPIASMRRWTIAFSNLWKHHDDHISPSRISRCAQWLSFAPVAWRRTALGLCGWGHRGRTCRSGARASDFQRGRPTPWGVLGGGQTCAPPRTGKPDHGPRSL